MGFLPSSRQIPAPTDPEASKKPHKWGRACSWEASQERDCLVCGVTETPGIIRADMEDPSGKQTGKKSRLYHYRDASGKTISSLVPLLCPVYIGDVNGAVAESKQRIRDVTGRVGTVEGQVESLDARVERLEQENEDLKAQVSANRMEVVDFVRWLGQMVSEHTRNGLPAVTVDVQGQSYLLPPPVASVITSIGSIPKEDIIEAEYEPVTLTKVRRGK